MERVTRNKFAYIALFLLVVTLFSVFAPVDREMKAANGDVLDKNGNLLAYTKNGETIIPKRANGDILDKDGNLIAYTRNGQTTYVQKEAKGDILDQNGNVLVSVGGSSWKE